MTPLPPSELPRRIFLKALAGTALGAAVAGPLEAATDRFRDLTGSLSFRGGDPSSALALRERYLLSPDIVYLNHASIGTIPAAVHQARVRYLALCEENPWLYMWGGAWEGAREDAREALGRMLGSSSRRMALTHNTTEGFNLLANGLPLGPGDEVVFTSLNHDGASVCWEHNAARRGFTVRRVPFPVREAPGMSHDDLVRFHTEILSPETRVLALPHVDNMVGIRIPLAAVVRAAREAGVEVVAVDGAQTAGMIPLDLTALGADAYAGSPHKWIQAPKGLGFMDLSPSLQERLEPFWVTWGQRSWSGTVRRFEDYGTRNLAETVNLADAVAFQEGLGQDEKDARYRHLWAWMKARVDASPVLTWRSPERWELGASLVAVEVRGRAAPELGTLLYREHGVVLRSFGGELNALRVSPNVITTEEELEGLFRILESEAA